jgi:hypothetical protein
MRYLFILLLAFIALSAPMSCGQGAVIVIIDGMGSSYLPRHTATYASGGIIDPIDMASFADADAQYQLKVPVPATEYGHAVIATGYSNVSPEGVAYYHATIFDALKDDGYIAMGILENGDAGAMLGELDVAVRNKNDSIYSPSLELIRNGNNAPPEVVEMMRAYPLLEACKPGKDPYAPYIRYNAWALNFARDAVSYMNESEPGLSYVLIVNAGGLDSAGQNLGYDGYMAVLSGMDGDLGALIDVCRDSGTVLMITGDHGMSFPDADNKGSHSNARAASRNESLLVPLLIYANVTVKGGGTYGQECLAPTLLSMLDEPNTMSMSDGDPLPVKEKPALFLLSKSPVDVYITGPGMNISVSVNGTYRMAGLEKGDYLIRYDGVQETIRLEHDTIVDVWEGRQSPPASPPWMAYVTTALVSIAGIAVALKLAWARK